MLISVGRARGEISPESAIARLAAKTSTAAAALLQPLPLVCALRSG